MPFAFLRKSLFFSYDLLYLIFSCFVFHHIVLSILFSIPFTSDYNYVLNSNISSSMGFPLSLSLTPTLGVGVFGYQKKLMSLCWRGGPLIILGFLNSL